MAWSIIGKPGSETGPCKEPCKHTDCAAQRIMAADKCGLCGKPIGYETKWCVDLTQRVHFVCVLEKYP